MPDTSPDHAMTEPRHVPLMVPEVCVSCMVTFAAGLFDEFSTPFHEPEMFSEEPSEVPSLDGSVALEQADATTQTMRTRSLRMRPHRQIIRQRHRMKFRENERGRNHRSVFRLTARIPVCYFCRTYAIKLA